MRKAGENQMVSELASATLNPIPNSKWAIRFNSYQKLLLSQMQSQNWNNYLPYFDLWVLLFEKKIYSFITKKIINFQEDGIDFS